MTPSLLPRGALFQGLVSGVSGAIGYGLGVFSVWLVRYMRSKDSSPPPPRWSWLVLIPVGAIGMVVMAIRFHVWQDRVRDLMGVEHLKWYDYPEAAILSVVVLFSVRRNRPVDPPADPSFWSARSTGSRRFASRRRSWCAC